MIEELQPIGEGLERNRVVLAQVFDPMSEEEMSQKPRPGAYSGRELLAHLAGADRGMLQHARRMAAGENPRVKQDFDIDYYNSRHQEKRADQTAAQLRAEIEDTRRELLAFMETVQPEDLAKPGQHPVLGDTDLLGVLRIMQTHELDHVKEFQVWSTQA